MTATAPPIADKPKKDTAWARDYEKGCACPWRWNRDEQRWVRVEGASCGRHR